MARVKSHTWDNRKERLGSRGRYNGWTRRARWYCRDFSERNKDVRISFEDELGSANKLYGDDKEAAERDWHDFRAGRLDTATIRNRQ